MKSRSPKVLHPICGVPMVLYPLCVLATLGAKKIVVVVGHSGGEVKEAIGEAKGLYKGCSIKYAVQSPQRGTGHAVMCASKHLAKTDSGDVLIVSGDVPLIRKETLAALIKLHRRGGRSGPAISFVSVVLRDPSGYGRVVRGSTGKVAAIVEDKDLKKDQRRLGEINAGIYVIKKSFLTANLRKLTAANKQGEYYLPDLVSLAALEGKGVKALTLLDAEEVMGINNRIELARGSAVMRGRINDGHMLSGVTIIDPASTYIDSTVSIGKDATIYPGAVLEGSTVIGAGVVIEEGVKITDSTVGARSVVKSRSIIESSEVGRRASIGPFARLRPESNIGDNASVGNFVEVKRTTIGRGSKANHLSYLGDATVGKDVNIGAGTICCNSDGKKKHKTVIEDNAFIGSDTQLVAPVRIGKGAYVGSGSTITKNVPPGALALTRAEQKTIKGWAGKGPGKKAGKGPGRKTGKKAGRKKR